MESSPDAGHALKILVQTLWLEEDKIYRSVEKCHVIPSPIRNGWILDDQNKPFIEWISENLVTNAVLVLLGTSSMTTPRKDNS